MNLALLKQGVIVRPVGNYGLPQWLRISIGLPQENAFDLIYRHGLVVDETGERLAMGSTTGAVWTSDDGGDAWSLLSAHLPPVYALRFA